MNGVQSFERVPDLAKVFWRHVASRIDISGEEGASPRYRAKSADHDKAAFAPSESDDDFLEVLHQGREPNIGSRASERRPAC